MKVMIVWLIDYATDNSFTHKVVMPPYWCEAAPGRANVLVENTVNHDLCRGVS